MVQTQAHAVEQEALVQLGKARGQVVQSSTPSRVADALRQQIGEGRFPPGSRLREEAIAEALAVSRNTVREAFVELAGDRLVVREPNRGVFVATLTAIDVVDIFSARRALETGAVRAGGSAVIVASARLAASECLSARDRGDGPGAALADLHFHRSLVALAGSARLNRLMRQILSEVGWVLRAGSVDTTIYFAYADSNARICRLVEAGKYPAAARLVNETLTRAEHEILAAIG